MPVPGTVGTQDLVKDPDARLDYLYDWDPWLPEDDTITSSVWMIQPSAELAQGSSPYVPSFTDRTVTVWLVGGVDGRDYKVTNRITTAAGRIQDHTETFKVREQ